jgi:GNAT superfamily N-acetyltransferase
LNVKHIILKINIRKGIPADQETIARFQQAMANETENIRLDQEILSRGIRAIFNDPGKGQYFVAEFEDKIVASLMTTFEWSDWRNSTVWWLQSVYVLPEFRKQGIFRKMYEHVKSEVEKRPDVGGIRLYMVYSNTVAASTYEAVGMDGERYRMFEWMKEF